MQVTSKKSGFQSIAAPKRMESKHRLNQLWWSPSKVATIGTIAVSPQYGGIHISEASSILPVGVVMCTCVSTTKPHFGPFHCRTRLKKVSTMSKNVNIMSVL